MDEEGGETAPGRSGQASQVNRPAPRPFPAIDPEPAHRYARAFQLTVTYNGSDICDRSASAPRELTVTK